MKKGSKNSLYKSNENLQPAIKILDYKLNADIVYIQTEIFDCISMLWRQGLHVSWGFNTLIVITFFFKSKEMSSQPAVTEAFEEGNEVSVEHIINIVTFLDIQYYFREKHSFLWQYMSMSDLPV